MSCVSSMTAESKDSIEFIYCGCNCGFTRSKYDNRGRQYYFIKGHNPRNKSLSEEHKRKLSIIKKGKKLSEEHRKNVSEANRRRNIKGEKHWMWKGDDVGYMALHDWIRENLPPQKLCQICYQVPPEDCACVTKIYKRDFINWLRLCTKCHKHFDEMPRNPMTGKFIKK